MANAGDRFYLLEFRPDRPVFWGDIGNLFTIQGLVLGGMSTHILAMLPSASDMFNEEEAPVIYPDLQGWSDFIHFSDTPEILTDLNAKIFQRKVRYEISGEVQQRIWAADKFKCMYCGVLMGRALMTVDHFMPLELGGANNPTNYLTACKRCNKDKGNTHPADWCAARHLSYTGLQTYLGARKI